MRTNKRKEILDAESARVILQKFLELIAGLAQQLEHIALIELNTGLIEGVDT